VISIEDGLIEFLSANEGLTALIGGRVYKNRLPQGVTLPCLTVQRITTPRQHSHDTAGSAGTARPRFQIGAWGTTYATIRQVTDALRAALNGYKGTMGAVDPVTVQGALIDDERYNDFSDAGLVELQSDYIIWHLEA
jgi:hypothetical protein